jgi:hypothetical protein
MLTSIYSDSELARIYYNDPVLKRLNKILKNVEENYPIERSYKNNNLFNVVETRGETGDALFADVMTKMDRRTRQINDELNKLAAARVSRAV